jgi:Fe-S cluster assembly protein SufD
LALSNTAIINAKPNLMISNPNTIASHGNSIGNIDASTLFYLRQKGLNKDQAIAIIITSLKNQFFEIFSNNFNTSIFMKWTQS